MNLIPTNYDPNVSDKRNMYVGGSDIPTILGINKYKTQFELAQEKVGIKESDFKGNEYTHFGNVMEPQIRDYLNVINETKFKEATRVDDQSSIRSNTDGYDPDADLILEIKTHGKNPTKKVYEAQMQLYMYQFDVEYGWLALYERPADFDTEFDSELLNVELIERDNEQVQKILDAIETFWIRCEFLKEKPLATEQEFLSFGQNEVALLSRKVEKLENELTNYKEVKKKHDDMKQQLHDAMEEYDIKKWDTGNLVITRVLPSKSMRFDSTTFKKEHPDLHEQYQKESKKKGFVKITAKKEAK